MSVSKDPIFLNIVYKYVFTNRGTRASFEGRQSPEAHRFQNVNIASNVFTLLGQLL